MPLPTKILFDIETNGLLRDVHTLWIFNFIDLDTGKQYEFLPGDNGWKDIYTNADVLAGHNIAGYDIVALEKLFGVKPKSTAKIRDTLILSQVLNYKRFGMRGHSLSVWGESLGFEKLEFNEFHEYSEKMRVYGERDVQLNKRVYDLVMNELTMALPKTPQLAIYLKAETAAALWCARAELNGWPFDMQGAIALFDELDTELSDIKLKLEGLLGMKCVPLDKKAGIVEPKTPKYNKDGTYSQVTAKYFDINPLEGLDDRPVEGPFSRVKFEKLSLDSSDDVKLYLKRHGWQPSEFNTKVDPNTGQRVQMSPKIVEEDLELLGENGKLYLEYLTARSRYSILKTWLEETDDNNNLHGSCMVIGTPSMRARHKIIVNVPSVDSKYGTEMRKLFVCKPGWKVIGCDSAGNQARGLAHYLGDPTFIDTLLNGDIHQYNADALTSILKSMKYDTEVKRSQAKRILYAFLFGASGGKLWSYIFGNIDKIEGNKLKNGFIKAVPGFKDLLDKLGAIYGSTSKYGEGYIPSIAGNRIYVDSFHKLLVYLLQSCEKITCAAAVMLTMERLEAEGIPYIPLVFYHDEEDFMVPEEHAERAAEIGKQAFVDGPKLFGIEIMDGEAKIGNSWYEVH